MPATTIPCPYCGQYQIIDEENAPAELVCSICYAVYIKPVIDDDNEAYKYEHGDN